MKKITTYLLVLSGFNAFCQPILNSSDLTSFNVSSNYFEGSSATLNSGGFGANITWNYSTIALAANGTENIETVSSAPYSANFPAANYFTKVNNEYYAYHNLTATKLDFLGDSFSTTVSANYLNPETLFTFPFIYNSSLSDTYQESSSSPVVSKVTVYDAYGTLILPFGTYTNCMRIKTTYSDTNEIAYNWFKLSPFRVIASCYILPSGPAFFDFYQATNLSADSFVISKISIFPNPVSSVLNVAMANNAVFSRIIIQDSLGKIIFTEDKNNTSAVINTENFSSGLYFVSVIADGQKSTTKFIKN